mmetsp:Transcript_47217/g.112343  ORF Transcript_47217/g.112343 Transcript_47217/m.112343 type:complete len:92 (-) Transcript_47217:352-627(-)
MGDALVWRKCMDGTSTMGRWFGATMVTMVIAAALLPAGRPGQVKDTGSRKTFAATTDLGDFMASERCLAGPFDDGAAAAFRCLLLSQSGSI